MALARSANLAAWHVRVARKHQKQQRINSSRGMARAT